MAHLLFPHFLQDSQAYASAQRFWENLWGEILLSGKVEHVWTVPWMRAPTLDGNPIFTAVCRSLGRAVRIIQEELQDAEDIDFDWWLDDFGDHKEGDAIRELVIACCPSAENVSSIRALLEQWTQVGEFPRQRSEETKSS
jgi:hypothetical protein